MKTLPEVMSVGLEKNGWAQKVIGIWNSQGLRLYFGSEGRWYSELRALELRMGWAAERGETAGEGGGVATSVQTRWLETWGQEGPRASVWRREWLHLTFEKTQRGGFPRPRPTDDHESSEEHSSPEFHPHLFTRTDVSNQSPRPVYNTLTWYPLIVT